MKINYLENSKINKLKWDECIRTSRNGIIYAYSWYLDIIAENWDALIAEDYSIIMPLIWKKRLLIKLIYQPYYTQQSGIFSRMKLDSQIIEQFISSIPKKFKDISVNFNSKNFTINYNLKERTNIELNLNKPYESLHENFSDNTKRNIIKAERNKLIIRTDIKTKDLLQINEKNLKISIKKRELEKLKLIVNECIKRECTEIYGVYKKEKLLSAAFFMFSHNKAYYLFSGTNPEGKDLRASFFLINNFIKKHAKENLTLDFEGSNISGIKRFFEGWGGKNISYYNYSSTRVYIIKIVKKVLNG